MLQKYFNAKSFFLLGGCFLAIGIPCDGFLRGLENTGLMCLLFSAILNYKNSKLSSLYQPINFLFIGLFVLCIFGYLYTDSIQNLNNKAGLKVLFLLFPIAFSQTPSFTDRARQLFIGIFVFVTAILATLTMIDYAIHFEEYNILIQQSKPIEIIGGTMHIYFSMILALSAFLGLHLIQKNFKIILTTIFDKLLFVAIIINIIALHVLSARTGLMSFYAALVMILLRHTIITRKYKTLIGGLFAMIAFPLVMYFSVPSVKNRIDNTFDDLNRYFNNDYVGYYSISGRFETWKVAIHIFEDHPIFGVGSGDLQQDIESQYLIDGTRLMREETLPNCHNQYIETLAAHGIIGFAVFISILIFMFGMVKKLPRNNYLMLAFVSLFVVGFSVESLFEREAGITLFLFFFYLIRNNAYDSEMNTSVAP